MTRPFGFLEAIAYAIRAGIAHYRFARTAHNADARRDEGGFAGVVTTRRPTPDEMNDVGTRWCDWNRMQGAQPIDPRVIWSDMRIMWDAYHRKGERVA